MKFQPSIVTYLAAWILVIGIGFALNGTAWGQTIIYYVLWLAILLLIVTRYAEIESIFTSGNIIQGNY
jgi:hypothetical protein